MEYRNFKLETDKDGIASLVWDMPDSRMNLLDTLATEELIAIVGEVQGNDAIKGVLVSSGKDSFSGGADINSLSRKYAEILMENKGKNEADVNRSVFEYCRTLSQVFRKIETCGKPWVALINGTCMGGGFEFALACHARIASDDRKVGIALPEIKIGLLAGAGGTQRVSRMCDLQAGLQFMLKGNPVDGTKAKGFKLVDEVVPDDEMAPLARRLLQEGVDPVKPWDKKGFKLPGGKVFSPAGFQFWVAANGVYRKETHDNYLAARSIMQSVFEGLQLPMDQALEVESRYFTNLIRNRQFEVMSRTFFSSLNELNRGVRRPSDQDRAKIEKVGVLGAGFMGSGIAYVTASAGMDVVLLDRDMESAEKGRSHCESLIDKAVKRGKATEEQKVELLKRIIPTASNEDLKGCDLVIEAVFEDRSVKETAIKAAEEALEPGAIFASNTSTLPITSLAEFSKHPDNFIGIHFFSPVEKMPLVEIIMGKETCPRALATAFDYVRAIRKTPIVVNDSRGFYTSRVVTTYVREGVLMLGDGIPAALIENIGKNAGMPVGPLALADEVALDLSWKIVLATRKDLGDKYVASAMDDILESMVVKLERFGRKNRKGFYDYPEKGDKCLWQGIFEITGAPKPAEEFDYEEIKQRLLSIMALETARICEEEIICDVREADVGSILGFGFAPYTGGTLSYIDTVGVPEFVARCEDLAKKWGDRFKPNRMLYEMAEKNQSFYPNFLNTDIPRAELF